VSDLRCPNCGQDVTAGFRYCPYCQAYLRAAPAGRPIGPFRGPTAHGQAKRDLMLIGFGLLALGILGVIAALLVITFGGTSGQEVGVVFVGGAFLLVFAGSMIAGVGLVRRNVPAASGCGSLAIGVGLGGLLFVGSLVFLFATCLAVVSAH
jgi:hypothetical protein